MSFTVTGGDRREPWTLSVTESEEGVEEECPTQYDLSEGSF